jgi:tetratricopeptide (TPR) repeat protein
MKSVLIFILGIITTAALPVTGVAQPVIPLSLIDTTATSLDSLFLATTASWESDETVFNDFQCFTGYKYVASVNQLNEFAQQSFDSSVASLSNGFSGPDQRVYRFMSTHDGLTVHPFDFAHGQFVIVQSAHTISHLVPTSQGPFRLNKEAIASRYAQSSPDCQLNDIRLSAECAEHRRFVLRMPDAEAAKFFRTALDNRRYNISVVYAANRSAVRYGGLHETALYRAMVQTQGRDEADEQCRKMLQAGMASNRYEFDYQVVLAAHLIAFRIVDVESKRIVVEWAASDSLRSSQAFSNAQFIARTQHDPTINEVDTQGDALLHRILNTRSVDPLGEINPELVRQPLDRISLDAIKMALLRGADPNLRDAKGMTPLHWACQRHDRAAIDTLLNYGSNPNIRAGNGETPFYMAVSSKLDTSILASMVDHGADVNVITTDMFRVGDMDVLSKLKTPLRVAVDDYCGQRKGGQIAITYMNTITFLLRHGASPRLPDSLIRKWKLKGGELLATVMDDVAENLRFETQLASEMQDPQRIKSFKELMALLENHACVDRNLNAAEGSPVMPWMGFSSIFATPRCLEECGLDPTAGGIVVIAVVKHGPGDKAGIKTGDIIRTIDGQAIACSNELRAHLATLTTGDKVCLEGWHRKEVTDYVSNSSGSVREITTYKAKPFSVVVITGERPVAQKVPLANPSAQTISSAPDSIIASCTSTIESIHGEYRALAQALANRAAAFELKQDWPNAIADYSAVLIYSEPFALCYFRRALCEIRLGKFEAATRDCDQAIELDFTEAGGMKAYHKTSEFYSARGLLRMIAGDFLGADEDLRMTRTDDKNAGYHYLYRVACAVHRNDADAVRRLLNNMPPSLLYDRWIMNLQQFLLARMSEEDLLKSARSEPKDKDSQSEALYFAGIRGLASNNKDQARRCFEQCLAMGMTECNEYMLAKSELARLPH